MIHLRARGILLQNDSVLLAYSKEGDYYFLPGGHIDEGESARTTVEREFLEECGIAVTAGEFVSVFEHAYVDKTGSVSELTFLFKVSADSVSDVVSKEEHLSFKWVLLSDIAATHFLPTQLVPALMSGEFQKFMSSIRP